MKTTVGGVVASDVLDRILRERAGEAEAAEEADDGDLLEGAMLDLMAALRANDVQAACEAFRQAIEIVGTDADDGLDCGGVVR